MSSVAKVSGGHLSRCSSVLEIAEVEAGMEVCNKLSATSLCSPNLSVQELCKIKEQSCWENKNVTWNENPIQQTLHK